MNEEFLNRLLKSISVSGYEEPVQEAVKEEMKACADEIREDEMHNLVCVMNPEHPVRIKSGTSCTDHAVRPCG